MNTGIVDHETGTRDLRKLGGLIHLMPVTATLGIIAAASMGGLPLLSGFLSKEMMLEQASHTVWAGSTWVLPVLVTLASVLSMAYSLRYIAHLYLGKQRDDYPQPPHDPGLGLTLPSAVLVVLVVLIGLFPETFAGTTVRLASSAVLQAPLPEFHLAIWHGWTPAVTMSAIAIIVGFSTLLAFGVIREPWARLPLPVGKSIFDAFIDALAALSRAVGSGLHNGSLQRYLFVIITTTLIMGMWSFIRHEHAAGQRPLMPINAVVFVAWLLLMGSCFLIIRHHADRLLALIIVNVIGLIASLGFVYLSAPDLALTQISVEVVTLILMLLALYFLPKHSLTAVTRAVRVRHGVLSMFAGAAAGGLTWSMMTRDSKSISEYYWQQAIPGSGGKNVVNVIIVDFRGFDTFGEIMVLGISALIIYALLEGMLRGEALMKLAMWDSEQRYSPNRHPLVMVVVTRLMLPLALMVSVFIFLRGHNMPGGGFIAALVVAIALIMQYMASGFGWAAKQVRFDYHALIGGGALIAAATGISAMVLDLPFLTSGHDHFHLPLIGDVELSSTVAFDLGVFLTVVGGVMLALAQLSYLGENTAREKMNEEPMDFDPSARRPRPSSADRRAASDAASLPQTPAGQVITGSEASDFPKEH